MRSQETGWSLTEPQWEHLSFTSVPMSFQSTLIKGYVHCLCKRETNLATRELEDINKPSVENHPFCAVVYSSQMPLLRQKLKEWFTGRKSKRHCHHHCAFQLSLFSTSKAHTSHLTTLWCPKLSIPKPSKRPQVDSLRSRGIGRMNSESSSWVIKDKDSTWYQYTHTHLSQWFYFWMPKWYTDMWSWTEVV